MGPQMQGCPMTGGPMMFGRGMGMGGGMGQAMRGGGGRGMGGGMGQGMRSGDGRGFRSDRKPEADKLSAPERDNNEGDKPSAPEGGDKKEAAKPEGEQS
jgi:hypothetical protein